MSRTPRTYHSIGPAIAIAVAASVYTPSRAQLPAHDAGAGSPLTRPARASAADDKRALAACEATFADQRMEAADAACRAATVANPNGAKGSGRGGGRLGRLARS